MTGKERMLNILAHEPVDRIGLYEHFWGDTHRAWQEAGHIKAGESYADHFGFAAISSTTLRPSTSTLRSRSARTGTR